MAGIRAVQVPSGHQVERRCPEDLEVVVVGRNRLERCGDHRHQPDGRDHAASNLKMSFGIDQVLAVRELGFCVAAGNRKPIAPPRAAIKWVRRQG